MNESGFVPANVIIQPSIPINGIYYIGQYGTSGYATAAKGYLYNFFSNGTPITWEPLRFDNSVLYDTDSYDIVVKSLINKPLSNIEMVIMHSTPDLWPEFWNTKMNILRNKVVNGYCTWETNILPEKWVDSINNCVNEVWCPSSYNMETFKNSGVTRTIRVVPHIFLYRKLLSSSQVNIIDNITGKSISKDGIYTFYTIGELNARKGIDDIIKVYCCAFKAGDPVRLIIKIHYRDYSLENKKKCEQILKDELKKYPNHPPIICLFNNMSSQEILALHSIGDCYISLTKSEGFGLTIFDAFNYKKNIIVTGYSGHVDFLGKNHPGLVNYKLGPVTGMSSFSPNYTEEQTWAYPDVDHAIELMKKEINI